MPKRGFKRPPPPPTAGTGIGDWVIHKSNQLLAFNKPAALAVQTAAAGAPSLQRLASAYAKRDLYLIHRIDQPASGVVLFARHQATVERLQRQFAERTVERTYLAVVEQAPEVEPGTLVHHLRRDGRTNKSSVVDADTPDAKRAELSWRLLGNTDRYPVLAVTLASGRHHQIRAQLAAVGAPVHGDVKYGARRANADRSIHLHAHRLAFDHPVSRERLALEAALPVDDPIWTAVQGLLGA